MRNARHRLWPCIAAAVAVAVIAVPAASAGVHRYDAKVTINHEGVAIGHAPDGYVLWHGSVESKVRKCERGRRVVLFKARPGADRRVGVARTVPTGGWGLNAPGGRSTYAKVKLKVRKGGDMCLAGRSMTYGNTLG